MKTATSEPSWDVLVRLVGRRVTATHVASEGTEPVPLTVADVTDAVTCGGWTTFTATLVGTSDGRLVAPGRYDVTRRRHLLQDDPHLDRPGPAAPAVPGDLHPVRARAADGGRLTLRRPQPVVARPRSS